MRTVRRSLRPLPRHVVLILMCIAMAYPLAIIVLTSLKSNEEVRQNPTGLPEVWTLENYVTSWTTGDFTQLFINSVFLTFTSMTIATIAAALASYAIVRRFSKVSSFVYLLLAAGIFLPLQLAVIPQFKVVRDLGLFDTYAGVIGIYSALCIPFGVFLIAAFMRQLPHEITEAAVLDGAGYFRMFWSVYMPLSRPAIATFWVLQGVQVWNDYLVPLLFLSDPSKRTLTTGILAFKQEFLADWGNIMAGVVIMSIPVIVLFVFAQRFFISGLYAGAVK
ncbi:carbohydrate ABC transporter permease [Microbacterium aquimaris]|uniref:Carbohydrate ABC transporter permease n=1 Tax=Microbacterium aquimaris TaxID=459816 RepID=A0ABU5N2Q6_9MICO|nr:carbohydrate ABC transporter permease [Microbacterium aquimaris]MDZ8160361.1 carbohydrate ABC transporter permease [Microbacterium aquimaris]